MSITRRFKSYFLRGLAVLLPAILTIWICVWIYQFIQAKVGIHVNRALVGLVILIQGKDGISKEQLTDIFVEGTAGSVIGFIIAIIIICVVGALLASVVGRALWRFIEQFIMNAPVLRRVYPYVKQITDFVLTPEEQAKLFSRVVALEYPRKGIWAVGFVTGSGLRKVAENERKEFLTVLVPNSPTPVTGYVVVVPKEQTIALDMTIEEAFRFTISAGVITPGNQAVVGALPNYVLEND
ncbi:MAG: hypothetical protein A2167_08725 [Planctomycetes bacterium RBG_13_46_10]|nr:MAG: hypothetical protein A2167_08725 [Planctomycetes bacterium RBG_13_46_10]